MIENPYAFYNTRVRKLFTSEIDHWNFFPKDHWPNMELRVEKVDFIACEYSILSVTMILEDIPVM
jgi:hypothetical protein